jgi:lipid-A-disaccharide synthase
VSRQIMVVAGEASGDLHGAALCRAVAAEDPGARVFGMGGTAMQAAGAELLADVSRRAVVGASEAVGGVPALYRTYRRLRGELARRRPAALVVIDFPEFNLRLAAAAQRVGVPVVYFVPPQIWAWRGGRIRTIRRLVSLVLAVFPFEPALYRAAGVRVEFVGHPLLDTLASTPTRPAARAELGLGPDELVIGLLPGSRPTEIARMAPLLAATARRIADVHPRARFLVAQAPTVEAELITRHAGPSDLRLVSDRTHTVMRAADLLLVTSGTATLEAALLGTPMVVGYRVSLLTEALGHWLLRVPWISLTNIILGRGVVPEFFERASATDERLAGAALALLRDPAALEAQRAAFREVAALLGEPGVGARAARLVLAAAAGAA